MKKLMILLGILFSVKTVFAQRFKPVKIDSLVTVSMPATYTQKDTLGQHIFTANTDLGYMVTIVEPNAKGNQPLKKENDLNSVLKKYIQGIQSQSGNGSAQFVRDTTVGTLKAKAFTLRTDDGSGDVQYRDFVLIYTTGATYTFQYGYGDARKDYVKDEKKAYFGSIKLSPELQRNDQYTDTRSSSSSVNPLSIIEIAGGVIVLFAVIWLLFFNKRNELA
ncbi:MAG: hypothetical protein JST19_12260 [Bacteroidetes bacterium]|nr:hypothetical protein [Bacteroidota bacterium]